MALRFPLSKKELLASGILQKNWYYSVELLPDVFAVGQYGLEHYNPGRAAVGRVDLRGQRCLDVATMEAVVPVSMAKRGASAVYCTDVGLHCFERIELIKFYHNCDFNFIPTPPRTPIYETLSEFGHTEFDVINVSGLLYHVFSPINTIGSVRPLLRPGGIMVVSTHAINNGECGMLFNENGRHQPEINTFWVLTARYFDYMLRYLRLMPIDCIWTSYQGNMGYLAVVCRALEEPLVLPGDNWMAESFKSSWEYNWFTRSRFNMSSSGALPPVPYLFPLQTDLFHHGGTSLNLEEVMSSGNPTFKDAMVPSKEESFTLFLS